MAVDFKSIVEGETLMATAAKFRIDVAIHDLLMNSTHLPNSQPLLRPWGSPFQAPSSPNFRIV